MSKKDIAALQTLHARIMMNRGRFQEAYAELKSALNLQGGLSLRV